MAASPRAPAGWLLIPLISGYLAAGILPDAPGAWALLGLALGLLALVPVPTKSRGLQRGWPVLVFGAGAALAAGFLQLRLHPPAEWTELPPREARLTVSVTRIFPSSAAGDRVHGLAVIREAEPHLAELVGDKIYFSAVPDPRNRLWPRSTELPVAGILRALPKSPESEFGRYLSRTGARFEYRAVTLRGEANPGRGFFAFCERQNRRFEQFLRTGANEGSKIAGVYVAMLLGKRSELTEQQEELFLISGTLHLFAISGLHIGVIAFALHNCLTLLRVPPGPAAAIGLALLFVFVGITGASPSAMRAFLMVLFFWSSRFCARGSNPVAALANSALLVLLIYPGQLWNPGFQLSYAVVAGILFLGLPLGRHLQETWMPFAGVPVQALGPLQRGISWFLNKIAATLAISLSATLLSSPLTIHYFGVFSPGAVFLNLLLIPLASLVLVAGFSSVVLNLASLGPLAAVYNHAGWLILTGMEQVARAAVLLPLFWQAAFPLPWIGPLALILVLAASLVCASRNWRAPFFHYAVPFLVFALILTTAARLTFPGE